MNNQGNKGNVAVILLIIVLLFLGYIYVRSQGMVSTASTYPAGYYASSSPASAYSAYYGSSPSTSRSYSYSSPKSSSTTAYSYYNTPSYAPGYSTTTYSVTDPGQNCYTSGYDQYGNPITVCQYAQ
jgi:hypothetical protein